MKKFLFTTLLINSLWGTIANAGYYTAYMYGTKQTTDATTHIIVAGVGMELGIQLQIAAVSKAKRYRELYPDHQIFLISHTEPTLYDNPFNNFAKISEWGFQFDRGFNEAFTEKGLLKQMTQFTKIASIDVFSHNSPQLGAQLESKYHRMTGRSEEQKKMAGRFLPDAYAILHGCNSGFEIAPVLSETWKIPVAGTFTGTGFEYLSKNGRFYPDGNGPGGKASINDASFDRPIQCSKGACTRMKPSNGPYDGIWGDFEAGGLNFFKFFCVKNDGNTCYRSMAKSLVASLSLKPIGIKPSLEDYKDYLYDFLCNSSGSGKYLETCKRSLEQYRMTKRIGSNGFRGRQFQCNFKQCYVSIKCRNQPILGIIHGTCDVKNLWNREVDTLEREYEAYLKGWELL